MDNIVKTKDDKRVLEIVGLILGALIIYLLLTKKPYKPTVIVQSKDISPNSEPSNIPNTVPNENILMKIPKVPVNINQQLSLLCPSLRGKYSV